MPNHVPTRSRAAVLPNCPPRRAPFVPSLLVWSLLALSLLWAGAAHASEGERFDPASPSATEALMEAASAGDLKEVRRLLDAGVSPNAANRYGATAIFRAADKGHADVARLLLEKGADVNLQDSFYQATPITWAFMNENFDVAELIIENGLEDQDSALGAAIGAGAKHLVATILDNEGVTRNGVRAALAAAQGGEEPDAELVARLEAALDAMPAGFELDAESRARYVGYYARTGEGSAVVIEDRDGELVAEFQNEARSSTPLDAESATQFAARNFGIELTFQLDGASVTGFQFPTRGGAMETFVRAEAPAAEETSQVADAADPAADSEKKASPGEKPAAGTEAAAAAPAMEAPKGVATAHWPSFRGPNAAGSAQGSPPLEWDLESGENVLWQTAVPGRAHSSPVVWGNRLYLTTAVPGKDEGAFRNGLYGDVDSVEIDYDYTWRVLALDAETGEILWNQVAHQGRPRSSHHIKATQANPSPVTDGQRVVAMMGSEGLYCYSADGQLLWKKDLGTIHSGWFYDATYQWGHSSSPILHDGKVIVQVDRHGDPFIAAFAIEDGRELWRTKRDNLPSWGTPTVFGEGEKAQIVTNGSNMIRGYDPDTGEELWQLGPNSEVTVGTPVVGHGLVYVTGGYPPVRPIYAIKPGAEGDLTLPEGETSSQHVAWASMTGGTYMPTPLVYGDLLYTLANNGVLGVYDAATGERLYRERVAGRGGTAFTASPVAADGRLYISSEDGDVYVVRHGREYELLAKSSVDEIIMASPAIAGDVLYVRGLNHVFALGADPAVDRQASAEASSSQAGR